MMSKGFFGWSPPHIQPLTPVSEVSEPPESPLPNFVEGAQIPDDDEGLIDFTEEEMDPPPAAVPFLRLFAHASAFDWFLMVLGSLAAAAHGAALVVYLHFFGQIIDLFTLLGPPFERHELYHNFTKHALYIVYIAAGVFVVGWIEVSCWILTAERQTAVIRAKYVQVLLNQDMSFFDTYGNNGDIVSQVLGDVLLIQSALSEKVGNYVHNMATFFGGLAVGFINSWQIALLTLATGPFIVAAGGISNIFLHRLAENIQDAYAEAASIAEQAVGYIRTLYAFTNETLGKHSYANSLQATLSYGVQISLVQGLGLGFTYGLAICSCALQLWFGRLLISKGKVSGGEVIAALFAIILSGLGLNQAATNFYSFEQGRIAAHRLFEMISRSPASNNRDGKVLNGVQGVIEFRNVYFSYLSRPDIPILSGFYLTVPAKKTVAIVGRNGSGKSSIIPLMENFYDPTLGEILLDGENIKNLNIEWLRKQIGLVTQEPALLSLSIKDNIIYGRANATMDQVEEAAKIAHAHTFISSLPNGYDTQITRSGLSLTEEQKIKIAIARAVLCNPCILLLDEVTGELDIEAERAVQEALDILMLGRSTIIIARRLSPIRNCDYIAVMEEGQLVEMGTHDELCTADGLYAELIQSEEVAKLPKRTPVRSYKLASFEIEKDISATQSQDPSPVMSKSPSVQRYNGDYGLRQPDVNSDACNSAKLQGSPSEKTQENVALSDALMRMPSVRRQDSFGMCLPSLPRLDMQKIQCQSTNNSDPESPVSPLLSFDAKKEQSPSKRCRKSSSCFDQSGVEEETSKNSQILQPPSVWRLAKLSSPEWLYALLGSVGAAIFGSFNPLLALILVQIVEAYSRIHGKHAKHEVEKWCLLITSMGVATVIANFLQHFYFGIMGEKMTERIRRMMFSAILRNEVGWFDEEENNADSLSMRLANDATFVRAAFSNRMSILVQDATSVIVAIAIGVMLEWRLALLALATLPLILVSAFAQKMWLAGFSGGIQEMHRKASLVLEDAVRNIYTVVAFCAGKKVMKLYKVQLDCILTQSIYYSQLKGIAFGASQFLLFACNAFLLWYASMAIKRGHGDIARILKEYMILSFVSFALVEPFGLAPYILKRRKSLVSVFGIIDRKPKIDSDDASGLKLPNVYGTIELKNVDFHYPTRPEVTILSNFNLKVNGGQTVAVVGASGSGKSTLIALLERFYDPVAGQIFLDGKDIRTLNLRWLRSHMGLVQQEPVLFSTSIRENIIYARHNASEAEMKEAARIANAHHFISSLPHGYDTHVGMRGIDLTPGQKQRIAIARVVLKNAPILLLDEASSNVESESSRVVQEALGTLILGNKTTLIIAHHFAMMRHVDTIVVLNDGRIIEEGTHDFLMEKNGLYVRLMQRHFAKSRWQHRLF
ncbi:ABC transporter B family member 20 [Cryptomeria japonica]|uniref:ABC transporter B family member 20 n=1 Tax=Cryptomeria japonica TaxID=3369 RepID=UPI0027DAB0F4|nr:ABC transporter B family member 20 [Cryptomeria japonica]